MNAAPISTSSEAAMLDGLFAGLIDRCRESEHAFTLAARSVEEPILRAELAQYSVQRQEFIADLRHAAGSLGHEVEERVATSSGGDANLGRALRRAAADRDRAALLEACEAYDLVALDAYQRAIHVGLPYTIASLLHAHFFALTRVQSRLRSLADVARRDSPIDNGHD